jgi:hypothetical protein
MDFNSNILFLDNNKVIKLIKELICIYKVLNEFFNYNNNSL